MTVRIIPADERIHWRNEWLDSWQSFPVTGNYDLSGNAHGLLMVHNDDTVDAGEGFDRHQHSDVEIVTWVLEGTLVHQDSLGNEGRISEGLAQKMSAGSGVSHSERNAAPHSQGTRLRVIQMWLPPDDLGGKPSYEESPVSDSLSTGELVTVASGMPRDRADRAISLGNSRAALHVARPAEGQSVVIPEAPYLHLFVARGSIEMEEVGSLSAGDAVRATDTGGHRIVGGSDAEILVWEMHGHA